MMLIIYFIIKVSGLSVYSYVHPPLCRFHHVLLSELPMISTSVDVDRDQPVLEPQNITDNRPHEQRRTQPRNARRLNHSFQHLYRHDSLDFDDAFIALGSQVMTSPREYLRTFGGYSDNTIAEMCNEFPPLQDLHVLRHLRPKMRFLKYTLLFSYQDTTHRISPSSLYTKMNNQHFALPWVPPQYFGSRLEKTIAPRHAFLIHLSLPHGRLLFDLKNSMGQILFLDFLLACRQEKYFVHLCKEWRKNFGHIHDPHYPRHCTIDDSCINLGYLEYFDTYFQRGILAAARNETSSTNFATNSVSTSQMIYLLIRHGSNALETDVRDISLFHWAAGSGNLEGLQSLINMTLGGGLEEALTIKADRDGATLLHWAAAGAEAKNFGCGGHLHICRYLLDYFTIPGYTYQSKLKEKEVVNACTKDGNSVLMWAAWSGSLDIVKLLVRHRADISKQNRNGCTVAHWAASGGNLDLCKYLHDILQVDFTVSNFAGNTPLSHAVAYGRKDVVQWLLDEVKVHDSGNKAHMLTMEMLQWTEDESSRKRKDLVKSIFGEGDYNYLDYDDGTL